ncbi:MAG: ATP-binding cassette domain-containing protein [Gemmatimonadales bacterium]|nr:ATP-binding cassette domain-containing protein [Gemmatimonadales bacterium]NIN12313.1 ATP-binding cassette domain-containing protein [Gemmatimonadales bacterium]NIN48851.1 ATP-binding cassette domain-containing protein [Gemmatimonadales bacterium]NIP06315.1 ATP-binding cassette domain-containing protein [Gemmatimonadales bacterium]NIR00687.1 ATP-binding cassette domain-containing protein [Gemmatimonadales bacterium]
MTPAPLKFENISLPGIAVGGATLEVPEHRAVLVVGPEASGVDALPGYALALHRPTTGRVFLFGQDVAKLPRRATLAFRRQVGYLPAGDGLLHNLSLRDNIALPLRFGSDMTEREIDGRIRIMLALLQLVDAADLRPASATDEQRRRAALARALAFDPDLVIMADPFDGLTNRAAAEVLELARGGEIEAGSRRTVFMTGQYVPQQLEPRIEIRYRLAKGELRRQG